MSCFDDCTARRSESAVRDGGGDALPGDAHAATAASARHPLLAGTGTGTGTAAATAEPAPVAGATDVNSSSTAAAAPVAAAEAVAWSINFGPAGGGGGAKRSGATAKEKAAIAAQQQRLGARRRSSTAAASSPADSGADTESPAVVGVAGANGPPRPQPPQQLAEVNVDECIDESVAVPRALTTTRDDIARRNYFDQQRWFCIMRPQYKRSCGVSSLTSVWNALYSRVGYGQLPPVSQEEVMTIIGFAPPFEDIRWGPFTGNVSLMRWFHKINKAKGVTGKSFYFWKPHGHGRTMGVTDEQAEAMTKDALRNPACALIYHCKNHYFVPIGYQEQPRAPRLALLPVLSRSEYDTQLLIGEPSRGGMPSIHVRAFADVCRDLHCEAPFSFNIRHPERGVTRRPHCSKTGGTLHGFIGFRSDVVGGEDDADLVANDEDNEDGSDADESSAAPPKVSS